jgi:hypothetical protein
MFDAPVLVVFCNRNNTAPIRVAFVDFVRDVVGNHLTRLVVELQCPVVKQTLEPSFELDELNVAIVVLNINFHSEVEDVSVRISKKADVVLISSC